MSEWSIPAPVVASCVVRASVDVNIETIVKSPLYFEHLIITVAATMERRGLVHPAPMHELRVSLGSLAYTALCEGVYYGAGVEPRGSSASTSVNGALLRRDTELRDIELRIEWPDMPLEVTRE